MDIKQAFAELGLTQQANHAEAKAAYRTLAMRWHPDVNIGIETDTRMKVINVAYAQICQYLDMRATVASRAQQAGAASGMARPSSGFSEFDWKTGFRSTSTTPQERQAFAQRTIRVSLFEAAFGCIKRVNGMEPHSCPRCAGNGESTGTWTVGSKCPKCFGHGIVNVHTCSENRMTCDACKSSGVFKAAPPQCPSCKGTGKTERRAWMVDVAIHAGTLDGMVVETRDIQMHRGGQALPRHLKLTVQIEKHPLFQLDQHCLSITVPISVWQWALGGEITVPTLDGSTRISLPNKPAAMLVKNHGWPQYKESLQRRPLFVLPKIIYPEHLRLEERCMLELLQVRSQLPEVQSWSRHVQAWVESSEQDLG